jgi:hypothetical protein
VLNFVSEYPSREYLSVQVYSKYSIESISIVFLSDCIFGIRNLQFSERFDSGYVSKLCVCAKCDGFAVLIFLLQPISKKIFDTTYWFRRLIKVVRYIDKNMKITLQRHVQIAAPFGAIRRGSAGYVHGWSRSLESGISFWNRQSTLN